jgi:predicted Fe-Mo cluster-binding NifX family protein
MDAIIALPTDHPGGMEAGLSAHFGHCDAFTVVTLKDGAVDGVEVLPSVPHEHGGCMAPVRLLAENGVGILVAHGMGRRPLEGFAQTGIMVLHAGDARTVRAAVDALKAGRLALFDAGMTCGGGAAA